MKQKPLELQAIKGRVYRGYYNPSIDGYSMSIMKDVRAMAAEIERLRAVQDLVDPLIGGIIQHYANVNLSHEAFRIRVYMDGHDKPPNRKSVSSGSATSLGGAGGLVTLPALSALQCFARACAVKSTSGQRRWYSVARWCISSGSAPMSRNCLAAEFLA